LAVSIPQMIERSSRTPQRPSWTAEVQAYAERCEAAVAMIEAGEGYAAAQQAIDLVLADPLFESLAPANQRLLVSAAGWVGVQTGQYGPAAVHYRRAVAIDPGDPDDWHRLSMAEDILGNHEAALVALQRLLTDWPQLSEAISGGHVAAMTKQLPVASETRLSFLTTLYESGWKRHEEVASDLWYELALAHAQRGDIDRARVVAASILWPGPLIRAQVDTRFDGVVSRDPVDASKALNRVIEGLEEDCKAQPELLYKHNEWLEALMHAGQHEKVLAISDDILGRIADAGPDASAFLDSDDSNFTLEIRADALRRLGRVDEAVRTMSKAATMTEYGQANVHQRLGLGRLYVGLLRPDDALAAVSDLPPIAEVPDLARAELVRTQALQLKDETEQAARAFDRLRAQGADAPGLLQSALLRAGRMDEAAVHFIGRLQDPRTRGDALWLAQDTRGPEPLPGDAGYRRNLEAMMAREDVREAIQSVGRIQTYDIWW
jgi:tetratricopeptide (TPR) repeat protein